MMKTDAPAKLSSASGRKKTVLAARFFSGRLCEKETLAWALDSKRGDFKREAMLSLLDGSEGRTLSEPWRSAWGLVQESWLTEPQISKDSLRPYDLGQRVKSGDRSVSLVNEIVEYLRPYLTVSLPFSIRNLSETRNNTRKPPSEISTISEIEVINTLVSSKNSVIERIEDSELPLTVDGLIRADIGGGPALPPDVVPIEAVRESAFLITLLRRLDFALDEAFNLVCRLGWSLNDTWRYGSVKRVESITRQNQDSVFQFSQDEHTEGVVGCVKMIFRLAERLRALDPEAASGVLLHWKGRSPLHNRMWAAMALDDSRIGPEEIGQFLREVPDDQFWDASGFNEISELRGAKFSLFSEPLRDQILNRILLGPSPLLVSDDTEANERRKRVNEFHIAAELKRLTLGGANLSTELQSIYEKDSLTIAEELNRMTSISDDLAPAPLGGWIGASVDARFDELSGTKLLRQLENAFRRKSNFFLTDVGSTAFEWIRQPGNAAVVLRELHRSTVSPSSLPRLLDRVGWAFGGPTPDPSLDVEQSWLIKLIPMLSPNAKKVAVPGLTHFLMYVRGANSSAPEFLDSIASLWEVAVASTNSSYEKRKSRKTDRVSNLDTLNDPAGKLVQAFFASNPLVRRRKKWSFKSEPARLLRDRLFNSTGHAATIVRYEFTKRLSFFLAADRTWARENLVHALSSLTNNSPIWLGLSQTPPTRRLVFELRKILLEKVVTPSLPREIRNNFMRFLVLDQIWSHNGRIRPIFSIAEIQQTLRNVDDEVRAHAAFVIKQCQMEIPARFGGTEEPLRAKQANFFRDVTAPILKSIWPMERSLLNRQISKNMVSLTSFCGDAYIEAIDTVLPYVVPSNSWSVTEFGISGDLQTPSALSQIDNEQKAIAFLRLVDAAVGSDDSARIPLGLSDVLSAIANLADRLTSSPEFRRLSALARR